MKPGRRNRIIGSFVSVTRGGGAAMTLALFVAATPAAPSLAQPAAALSMQGQVTHPHRFTLAELERLPAVTVTTRYTTSHEPQGTSYTGVLLWTLVERAGLIDAPGVKTHLQHVILARGSDGYAVALALGELDPALEGQSIIVAYSRDGKAIGSLKLIVPGDKHPARAVRDLVAIEAR